MIIITTKTSTRTIMSDVFKNTTNNKKILKKKEIKK
jgi:hypothetical protein